MAFFVTVVVCDWTEVLIRLLCLFLFFWLFRFDYINPSNWSKALWGFLIFISNIISSPIILVFLALFASLIIDFFQLLWYLKLRSGLWFVNFRVFYFHFLIVWLKDFSKLLAIENLMIYISKNGYKYELGPSLDINIFLN